jgi:Trypsin-like peptidase domain
VLPTFYHTGFNSPITEFAMMLLAQKENHYSSLGTAIIIGNHLAVTAGHVLAGYFELYGDRAVIDAEASEGSFSLQAVQFLNNGSEVKLWNIRQVVVPRHTDISFLALSPHTKDQLSYEWRGPQLQLLPPAVGSVVTAFGYHSTEVVVDHDRITIRTNPYSSRGVVQEIHHERRDASVLKFPCYRVNSRFAPAMSGGPVLSDDGLLCGIVCSSFDTGTADQDIEHTSYVTTLWPLMGTELSFDREGHEQNVTYPALECQSASNFGSDSDLMQFE